MYNSNYYDWYRQNDKLISDIEKAINGEYSAISCYLRKNKFLKFVMMK